jgi:hypothetical protein
MSEQQEPLDGLEACRVKFVDVALDEIDEPPDIDDRMHFTVEAICVGRTTERMKDGELRRTAKMRVTALDPQGGPLKPASPPSLFSVNGESEDDE